MLRILKIDNFDCKDLEYAKLNSYANNEANVSYNSYNGTGIIEYKSKRVYHQIHIANFISSYARINLMNQLLKIKLSNTSQTPRGELTFSIL